MIELNSLADLANVPSGEQVTFTALVVDIKQQVTSTNKNYTRIYLRDDKEAISVPLWDTSLETAKAQFNIDDIYAFAAITDTYNQKTVIKKFISYNKVDDSAIMRRMKQHMFKQATDNNIKLIFATLDRLKSTKYYKYLTAIYGENKEDMIQSSLIDAFASINHHDNYPGGYINHVGDMLRIAGLIRNNYLLGRCEKVWRLDWPYIMSAIMLHDIGKLETYTNVTKYTIRFKDDCLLDHNRIGVGMLYRIHNGIEEQDRLNEQEFQRLAYTISYHDDSTKLYEHKRLEDKIISYIDGLEATLAESCVLEDIDGV